MRKGLRLVLLALAGAVFGAGANVSVARAQTLTVTPSTSSVDTLATISDLTGTTTTFRKAFTVALTGCSNGPGTVCRVFMSARPKSGFGTLSNARWSAAADCSSATAVPSGTSPASSGTTWVLSVAEANNPGRNGSRTIWFCYDAVLSWSTAPQSFVYELYFRRVRQ
jgi:hypothetical protein